MCIEGARFYVSLLPIKERDENSTDVQVYIFLSVKWVGIYILPSVSLSIQGLQNNLALKAYFVLTSVQSKDVQ